MKYLVAIVFLVLTAFAAAQEKKPEAATPASKGYAQMCEVQLDGGQVYKGEVKEDNDSTIVLILQDKSEKRFSKSAVKHFSYYLAKSKIKFDKQVDEQHIGSCFYGFARNSFLFAPRKVEITSNSFLLFHYNYNLSRNFSVGLSTSLVFIPAVFHAKGHFQIAPKTYAGVELFGGISSPINPAWLGAGAFKFTYGDYNGHVSVMYAFGSALSGMDEFGYAYGIAGSRSLEGDVFAVGELWIAKNVKGACVTLGLRTAVKPRISWLWGIGAIVGDVARNAVTRYVIPFPYVGFSFRT